MSISAELGALRALARQMRSTTRQPDPRRCATWARTLDSAVRAIEHDLRTPDDGAQRAQETPAAATAAVDTHPAGRARQGTHGKGSAVLDALPDPGSQRRRLLQAVAAVARDPRLVGLTDVELQHRTGISPNSERPRRRELVVGGWLEAGERTREHYGTEHTVWVLADKGMRAADLWAPGASA